MWQPLLGRLADTFHLVAPDYPGFGHRVGTTLKRGGAPHDDPAHISTPDRRVRVFVSSTLQELVAERTAALDAITGLHLTPVMFELGARSHPPRELFRAYLESEVLVGIYWQQYGWVAPGRGDPGLEDEHLLCGDKPKLIYVKRTADKRDSRLTRLLARIQADDGASYKPFDGAADLAGLLADDLAVLPTERFAGSVGRPAQALRRAALPVPPTQIVDRRAEAAVLGDLLGDPSVHLVTLIGSGGIGKTRLAIEVARRWTEAIRGGAESAWFVDLAPVRDPASWVEALAGALGLRPEGSSAALEPIIDLYAAERLAERGETDATVGRLARYLIGVVQTVRNDLQGPAYRAAAERLDRERDEIRSAIDWALKVDDAETVGWLLTPLLTYWWSRGLLPMTHDLAEKAAALPSAARLAPYASALLLGAQGMAMVVVGQTTEAEPLLAHTLKTATTLGNARLRAYALLGLGGALANRSAGEASERLDEAAEAFRGTGD